MSLYLWENCFVVDCACTGNRKYVDTLYIVLRAKFKQTQHHTIMIFTGIIAVHVVTVCFNLQVCTKL